MKKIAEKYTQCGSEGLVVWNTNPTETRKIRWYEYIIVWYRRWRLVRAMKKSGIWKKLDVFYVLGKNMKK